MGKSSKTSVKVSNETLERINSKRVARVETTKEGEHKEVFVQHDDFQNFLLDALEILEGTAKGKAKAELQLKKFLVLGHDKEITPYELRLFCGVNFNTCKELVSKYQNEVDLFNSKF